MVYKYDNFKYRHIHVLTCLSQEYCLRKSKIKRSQCLALNVTKLFCKDYAYYPDHRSAGKDTSTSYV